MKSINRAKAILIIILSGVRCVHVRVRVRVRVRICTGHFGIMTVSM